MKIQIITSILFVVFVTSHAQVTDSHSLTLNAAKRIVSEARKYASQVNAPHGGPSIAVVDQGGNLLYLDRPEKTFAGSAMVAFEKARTAAMFEQPTRNFENKIKEGRTPLLSVGYNMLEGGVPIVVNGEVVGAIGVSGASSSQEDVDIAEAGAKTKIEGI
jgi:glc operon protein GlcG